jgi:dipeptidase
MLLAHVSLPVLCSRNDDGDGGVSPSRLAHHPRREGPAPYRSNQNAFTLELPGPGLEYFSLPSGPRPDPDIGRNATGEAAGWNSAGVAVSATESIYNSKKALEADPPNVESGVVEDAIPSVLLPQVPWGCGTVLARRHCHVPCAW